MAWCLQKQPPGRAAVPLPPPAALLFGHQLLDGTVDPADVLGHLSVNAVFPFPRAALAPAHDAGDEVRASVARDVRSAAVALARVLG